MRSLTNLILILELETSDCKMYSGRHFTGNCPQAFSLMLGELIRRLPWFCGCSSVCEGAALQLARCTYLPLDHLSTATSCLAWIGQRQLCDVNVGEAGSSKAVRPQLGSQQELQWTPRAQISGPEQAAAPDWVTLQ